ncbi:hypothetical protein GCM10017083_16050 [Thalassobaculum fulvum]|uniref:Uncharacterized protein n=1 Tax=Thalassobaculum fulvum TaxID=1633335 RepID=A0A918XRT4_9PROT|nr:hypothetical protein [Thalassobaculum fulvum]GHD46660.1 hypothetical protein GCM10017083_16050 [Thalassobaculum fulvum]
MPTPTVTHRRNTGQPYAALASAIRKRPQVIRWILAGPGATTAAILTMAAMPAWLPRGAAGVDNIVYPLVLAPLIWTVAFLYAVVEPNLPRGVALIAGAVVANGLVTILAAGGAFTGSVR